MTDITLAFKPARAALTRAVASLALACTAFAALHVPAQAQDAPKRAKTGAPQTAPRKPLEVPSSGTMSQSISATGLDTKTSEYIVAVVNQEPITSTDLNQRMLRAMQESQDASTSRDALRQQVLDTLIDERAQLAFANETGLRIDQADIDRAEESIAAQNQMTVSQLRERLAKEGQDYARFRRTLGERILLDRVRDRDVPGRIRIAEADVDAFIAEQLGHPSTEREVSVAQILIAIPEGANEVEVNERRARADRVLARAVAGEDFIRLAHDFSEDKSTRESGGEFGWRAASRLPDPFVAAITTLKAGDVAPALVRTDAGFHILKLLDRRDAISGYSIVQNHARHILMRPTGALTGQMAYERLMAIRQQIVGGQASFAQMARQYSQDGTATRGGDLGWAAPGQFVPEFQQAIDRLQPGQLSQPFTTRFGLHLVQLLDRREVPVDPKQLRDNARSALKEQRFEAAYQEWARDIRSQAYVEIRDVSGQ